MVRDVDSPAGPVTRGESPPWIRMHARRIDQAIRPRRVRGPDPGPERGTDGETGPRSPRAAAGPAVNRFEIIEQPPMRQLSRMKFVARATSLPRRGAPQGESTRSLTVGDRAIANEFSNCLCAGPCPRAA